MGEGITVNVRGAKEAEAAVQAMSRRIDLATLRAMKAAQSVAKSSVKRQIRGRPRWDHRGASSRTGAAVNLHLSPPHVSRSGGPGRLTGVLARGVGGVRKPKPVAGGGFQGGVGVGGGVRNLYKKRTEAKFPYFAPGVKKAEPKMAAAWQAAWAKATAT